MTVEFYRRLTEENPILTLVEGEKYMGMWQADARHGQAVLVTALDGLYIEGASVSSGLVQLVQIGTVRFFSHHRQR